MSADAVAQLCEWLRQVIGGIVKTPTAVSVNEIGRAHETIMITVIADPLDVGRVLGVDDANIKLIQRLADRAAALRGCRVQLVVPQKGERR